LLLLGWSLDDKTEDFTREAMIRDFSLDRINKAPASFDPQKLTSFQSRYMWRLEMDAKLEMVLPYLEKAGLVSTPASNETIAKVKTVLEAANERISFAGDILDYAEFFQADDTLEYEEKAFRKRLVNAEAQRELLVKLRSVLPEVKDFSAENLDQFLHNFVEQEGVGMGMIVHAIRVAITGKAVGFGLFDIMAIIGKDGCMNRIDRALQLVAQQQ
jgi:glutamyl-tRNA synthetase